MRPMAPRAYTREEDTYLFFRALTGPTTTMPRPDSITDQDIEDYLPYCRGQMAVDAWNRAHPRAARVCIGTDSLT